MTGHFHEAFNVVHNDGAITGVIADDGFATLTVFNIQDDEVVVRAINRAFREGATRGTMFTRDVSNDRIARMHLKRVAAGTRYLGGAVTRLADGEFGPCFRIDWEEWPFITEDPMSEHSERLRQIAPKLNALTADPSARVNYELMSGGLVWSDELPPWDELQDCGTVCLRAIWRYRSTLILGAPEERFRASWEEGQRLFPDWPGFLPDRQASSWREFFLEQEAKSLAAWEALDERYERQKAKRNGDSAAAV